MIAVVKIRLSLVIRFALSKPLLEPVIREFQPRYGSI